MEIIETLTVRNVALHISLLCLIVYTLGAIVSIHSFIRGSNQILSAIYAIVAVFIIIISLCDIIKPKTHVEYLAKITDTPYVEIVEKFNVENMGNDIFKLTPR